MDNVRGPIYPQILETLSLSTLEGSAFFYVASFVSVIFNFVSEPLKKRFGTVRALSFGLYALLLSFMCLYFTESYLMLLTGAALFGVGLGLVMVLQNVLISESVPKEEQGSFFSFLHSFYALAAIVSPLSVGWILVQGESWNPIFMWGTLGVLPLLFLVEYLAHKAHVENKMKAKAIKSLDIFDKQLILNWSVFLSFYVSAELLLSTRLVLYLNGGLGWSGAAARNVLMVFFIGLFLGRLLMSRLQIKNFSKMIFLLTGVSTLTLVLGLVHHSYWLAVAGFFMAMIFPLVLSEIEFRSQSFDRVSSRVIGFCSMAVVVMHIGFGFLSYKFGVVFSFWMAPVILFLAFAWTSKTYAQSFQSSLL